MDYSRPTNLIHELAAIKQRTMFLYNVLGFEEREDYTVYDVVTSFGKHKLKVPKGIRLVPPEKPVLITVTGDNWLVLK